MSLAEAIIKAVNSSMKAISTHDLGYFVPATKLVLGQPLVLDPPSVRERPLIKFVA
jgi:hypothetical protein